MFQNQEGYNALIFDERNIIIESGKHRVFDPIQVKFGMKIVFNCRPYKNEYPVFEICFLDSRSKEWLITQPISLDMPPHNVFIKGTVQFRVLFDPSIDIDWIIDGIQIYDTLD